MDKQLNILWLPGWFPSRVDFLTGDFIERHAKAVSEFALITVIYVVKDPQLKSIKRQIVKEESGGLTIYRGYYSGEKDGNIFNKISSVISYYRLLFTIYKTIKKEKINFNFCHVHVPLRQSLLALWLKRKYKIKYVVSEQNACYMPGYTNDFFQPFIFRWMVKKTVKNSSAIHVVSKSLGEAINKKFSLARSYTVIPNVVNTDVFKQITLKDEAAENVTNFIVITGDTWHKNTDGVIRAFSAFIFKGYNSKLHIIGPNIAELKLLAENLDIAKDIIFYGAVSNEKVASVMQISDAMIFFTRYETFGCVMAEALCCGVPVIASRLPVLEENLLEGVNGVFVQSENENDLTDKLSLFVSQKKEFDLTSISIEAAAKYNYHTIALQFMNFYRNIL